MPIKTARERAKSITPYPKLGTAWAYEGTLKKDIRREHGVISSAKFGACGYQDIAVGLTLELKLQDGFSMQWTFYSMVDIYELMDRTKADSIEALVGKPVFGLIKGFNQVVGMDVNDELVLDDDKDDDED